MKKENAILQKSSILNLDKRLNEVMKHLLIKDPITYKTKQQVAEKINFGRTNLSSALNGTKKYLTDGLVDKFVNAFPELNREWLITGKGSMLNEEKKLKTIEIDEETETKNKLPYYDINVTSSIISSFNDVKEVPAFYVDYKPFNDCTAIMPNYGDSMYPKYKNGEKLAVKQIFNLDVITWGETYLVVTNSNANDLRTIKDVFPHEDNSKIILRASNPNYAGDTVIDKEDIVSMFAVKGKISQNFI